MGVEGLEGRGGRNGLAALGRSRRVALSRRGGTEGQWVVNREELRVGDQRGNAVEARGDA